MTETARPRRAVLFYTPQMTTLPIPQEEILASVFEERAENLSETELAEWTVLTQRDQGVVSKLMGPGAKLLIGPRGSGKSTLLRTAYFRLIEEGEHMPAYVNYARSLALEPLFHRQANALQIFRQWVLRKLIVGVAAAIGEMKKTLPDELAGLSSESKVFIRSLENGSFGGDVESLLTPTDLLISLEKWCDALERKRCVLLLDDAAHAFSPEQQREFFEIFRELRSRRVAAKAAVYPGITSYSPNFHVGHEAEVLQAGHEPTSSAYLRNMREIAAKRLPETLRQELQQRDEYIDFLAMAAFGIPRGFLNMLSQWLGVEDQASKPTRRSAETAVRDYAESTRGIFKSLETKLPRLRHFVEIGSELERAIVATLRTYNARQRSSRKRTAVVGIQEPISPPLERILNMLEYSGLIRRVGSVSRGVKGTFLRFDLHYAVVISENALSLGKSFPITDVIDALREKDSHAFARAKGTGLLGRDFAKRCTLDLPPCQKCGTARVAEDQHFCMKCGAELSNSSVYEELLRAPISALALTPNKLKGIAQHTSLKTVQDLLMDDEEQELRRVPYIGAIWSSRIRTYAEEFVSV